MQRNFTSGILSEANTLCLRERPSCKWSRIISVLPYMYTYNIVFSLFLKKRGSKAWTLHLRYICVYECEWSFVIIDTILRKYAGISHIICIFEMRQTICNKNGRIDAHWTFWYDWKYSGPISVQKRPYSPLSTKSNIYTFIRIIITER